MNKKKTYRPYNPNQMLLFPPSLNDWLPESHMARFVGDVIDTLDISEIERVYENELRGYPPHHPRMMLKILIYGYCTGVHSSRKLAKKCEDEVAFRYLSGNNLPKFRAIADFRARHLAAFKKLFLQVLLLCKEAGLMNLGHVALDGTKFKANASKHKGTSYGRLKAEEQCLKKEIEALISQAQNADNQEDAAYGKDNRGDEIPEELRRKEDRLKKIREAKAALEARAAEKEEKNEHDKDDPPPAPPDKEQYNFTDPESRIMPRPDDKKAFFQGYNAQAVVNEDQIIVANDLIASPGDAKQLPGMMAKVRCNTDSLPDVLLADAGYFSEVNVGFLKKLKVKALIPPDRQGHGFMKPNPGRKNSAAKRMRKLLETEWGRRIYRQRKAMAEPVFGQIKSCMCFTQFSLRGLAKVKAEWDLVCLCHNLRKLYRFRLNEG